MAGEYQQAAEGGARGWEGRRGAGVINEAIERPQAVLIAVE